MIIPYILTPEAYQDLAEALAYLTERSPAAGESLALRMRESFMMLAEFPEAGRRRPEYTQEDLRFWHTVSYFIVYRVHTDQIEIIAILHSAREIAGIIAGRPSEDLL